MKNNSCALQDKLLKTWPVYINVLNALMKTESFKASCTLAKLATPSKDDSNSTKRKGHQGAHGEKAQY